MESGRRAIRYDSCVLMFSMSVKGVLATVILSLFAHGQAISGFV